MMELTLFSDDSRGYSLLSSQVVSILGSENSVAEATANNVYNQSINIVAVKLPTPCYYTANPLTNHSQQHVL